MLGWPRAWKQMELTRVKKVFPPVTGFSPSWIRQHWLQSLCCVSLVNSECWHLFWLESEELRTSYETELQTYGQRLHVHMCLSSVIRFPYTHIRSRDASFKHYMPWFPRCNNVFQDTSWFKQSHFMVHAVFLSSNAALLVQVGIEKSSGTGAGAYPSCHRVFLAEWTHTYSHPAQPFPPTGDVESPIQLNTLWLRSKETTDMFTVTTLYCALVNVLHNQCLQLHCTRHRRF